MEDAQIRFLSEFLKNAHADRGEDFFLAAIFSFELTLKEGFHIEGEK